MNPNDSTIPENVSWVDYCDALGNEAWLESQKRSLRTRKRSTRINLQNISTSTPVPKDSPTLNGR